MIEILEFEAPSIKNFPMGDSARRLLPVYIPSEYDKKEYPELPLVVVLGGWGSRSLKLVWHDSAFGKSLVEELDDKVREKKMPPAVVAFPDGSSKLGFSQYINSPSLGNYQDYITKDLIEFLSSRFRLKNDAAFRAVAGHSSGGFAAFWMGFQASQIFSHVYAVASDSYFEVSILPSLVHMIPELERAGGVKNFIDEFLKHPDPMGQSYSKFITMMNLSLAPCYSPAPGEAPLHGHLFFDPKTAEIKNEVWQNYLSFDPVRAIEKHFEDIRNLKSLHLEAGIQDEYAAQLGHRQISNKLKAQGIKHEWIEHPGRHSGHNWRYFQRIETILKKMYS